MWATSGPVRDSVVIVVSGVLAPATGTLELVPPSDTVAAGSTARFVAILGTESGEPVADGTVVRFGAMGGVPNPTLALTVAGIAVSNVAVDSTSTILTVTGSSGELADTLQVAVQ